MKKLDIMKDDKLEKLKFPIGHFKHEGFVTKDQIEKWNAEIAVFPQNLRRELFGLLPELDWKYRPEGWTIRQVVHHCADSHMNAFIRFKLSLTEDRPEIRPYFEDRWAELPDTVELPLESSLRIIEGVHQRWTHLISSMKKEDFDKVYIHPEHGRSFRLDEAVGTYAWHCNHHFAHVIQALHDEGNYQ